MIISIAQLDYTIGDFDGNTAKIVKSIERAKKENASVVIFSEQAISGRPAYDLLNDVVFLEQCNESLQQIVKACEGITAIIGTPLSIDNHTVSAAAVIYNGKIVKYIGKQNVQSRDERSHIGHSKGSELLEVGGKNIAVVLGSDIFSKETVFGSDVDLIVSLKSSHYERGIIEKRYDFYSKLAYRRQSNVVVVNHVGGQTDIVYDGSSAVFNAKGEAIGLLKKFEEDFITIDLDADNRPLDVPQQSKTENVYYAIKLGLRDYFRKNGFKTACLGLSGGIDSAVVCALAVEVLGAENVRVLMMPSQYSSDHSVDDALALARKLGVHYDIVPITETYTAMTQAMSGVFEGLPFDVTEENMQARLRGAFLMALSNKFGCILLNTANKSETAVGYGTLYGDTVGALGILGDLYKREVFSLARYINRNEEIIPKNTLLKEPSAELRPEQKDSDYLPDYDTLDAILYRLIEENQSVDEIATAGFDYDEVKRIYTMFIKNGYKRKQSCPVLRLSICTLGQGKILPLTYDFSCLL